MTHPRHVGVQGLSADAGPAELGGEVEEGPLLGRELQLFVGARGQPGPGLRQRRAPLRQVRQSLLEVGRLRLPGHQHQPEDRLIAFDEVVALLPQEGPAVELLPGRSMVVGLDQHAVELTGVEPARVVSEILS